MDSFDILREQGREISQCKFHNSTIPQFHNSHNSTIPQFHNTRIYLSPPCVGEEERRAVGAAFDSKFVAPCGPMVDELERRLAKTAGRKYAVALASGTAAIDLAMAEYGVDSSWTVIAPTLTFIATVGPAFHRGAKIVFVDSDETGNIDVALLRDALEEVCSLQFAVCSSASVLQANAPKDRQQLQTANCKLQTANAARVMVIGVDLYGRCCDYAGIRELCDEYGAVFVCDAAEAVGASFVPRASCLVPRDSCLLPGTQKNQTIKPSNHQTTKPSNHQTTPSGSAGEIGVYSFNGNKIITTSGGGALLTDDEGIAERARKRSQQSREPFPWYQHEEVGYNYRMSNILAAVGLAQLEKLPRFIKRRNEIKAAYAAAGLKLLPPVEGENHWLAVALLGSEKERDDVLAALAAANIEARPVWKPLHLQPVFAGCRVFGGGVAEDLFRRGICLPTGSGMTDEDIERVVCSLQFAVCSSGKEVCSSAEQVCSLQFAVCSGGGAETSANKKSRSPQLQTANCKLQTANCKLQTANCKLQTANSPRALILGYGRSGKAAEELLKSQGYSVTVLDGDDAFESCLVPRASYPASGDSLLVDDARGTRHDARGTMHEARCTMHEARGTRHDARGTNYAFAIVSPGIPLDHPWQAECRMRGIPVKSELQLGCEELRRRGVKLIAVTGSKGKSSVVKLVADALHATPCGNFGLPVSEVCSLQFAVCSGGGAFFTRAEKELARPQLQTADCKLQTANFSWAVVEVSSFQMETTDLAPDTFEAAAILNLQEDHLDRHGDVATYHALKRKLLTFARTTFDCTAPNADHLLRGSYFDNEILRTNGAIAAALMRTAGLDDATISAAFASFVPLPHRMNTVLVRDGVRFIDDSKATSIAALAAGVRMAGGRVRLIAGGLAKGDDTKIALPPLREGVRKVYTIGRSAESFASAWSGVVDCEVCGTLENAVAAALRDAEEGDCVLLSPGAASFDQFRNFGERGDVFAGLVKKGKGKR